MALTVHVEGSGQTISWFKDRLGEDCLVFKPPFQRKPVWLEKHRAYLIDTVLRGLPIPEVYIQKDTDEHGKTIYSVVDGQQRIRALLDFPKGRVALMEKYTEGRDGETWDDLSSEEKRKFWNYRLIVREIEGASDSELRDLFRRLNIHTVILNAQELRNAKFKGDFITTVTELADEQYWAESRIVTATEIRRMLDIEYISELFIGIMHGPQNKKASLDAMFEAYEDKIPDKHKWLKRFEDTRATVEKLVPYIINSRWRGKSDYYSLFLGVDTLIQKGTLNAAWLKEARTRLEEFGNAVTYKLSKEGSHKRTTRIVANYSVAVEKAASDKDRRENRVRIIEKLIGTCFK